MLICAQLLHREDRLSTGCQVGVEKCFLSLLACQNFSLGGRYSQQWLLWLFCVKHYRAIQALQVLIRKLEIKWSARHLAMESTLAGFRLSEMSI